MAADPIHLGRTGDGPCRAEAGRACGGDLAIGGGPIPVAGYTTGG